MRSLKSREIHTFELVVEEIVANLNYDLRDQEGSEWNFAELFKCKVISLTVLLFSHI